MAVRLRMKKMGRTHRPFFRVCAMDQRSPRDGRVIEELGTYDPMCPETDARVTLKAERVDYWLGVGAQPSDKVATLIKKYGTNGTHLEAQKAAFERLSKRKELHACSCRTSQEEEGRAQSRGCSRRGTRGRDSCRANRRRGRAEASDVPDRIRASLETERMRTVGKRDDGIHHAIRHHHPVSGDFRRLFDARLAGQSDSARLGSNPSA